MSPTSAPGSIGWEDACRVPKKVSPMNMKSEKPATMTPSTRADHRKNGMTSFSGTHSDSREPPLADCSPRFSSVRTCFLHIRGSDQDLRLVLSGHIDCTPTGRVSDRVYSFSIPSGSAAPGVCLRISVWFFRATSIVHPRDEFQTVFTLFPFQAAPLRH